MRPWIWSASVASSGSSVFDAAGDRKIWLVTPVFLSQPYDGSSTAKDRGSFATLLAALPDWVWAPEVSFSIYGERGVLDILAFHPPSGMLLIIELKTEIVDVEELVGVMDRRRRLGARIAAERWWGVKDVSCWVVVRESATNRRRLAAHAGILRHAFPADGNQLRQWLRQPTGRINALSLLSNAGSGSGKTNGSLPKRVRMGRNPPASGASDRQPALTAHETRIWSDRSRSRARRLVSERRASLVK